MRVWRLRTAELGLEIGWYQFRTSTPLSHSCARNDWSHECKNALLAQ